MIDLSAISNRSVIGRTLRAPLRIIPGSLVVRVLQGPLLGARWVVGSSNHGCWLGCYESKKQRACLAYAYPGMTVYDLGANVGFYTLLFSRLVGSNGAVHAFEPVDRNLEFLRRHLAMNEALNVRVHAAAVGRKSGLAAFDPAPGPSMGRIVSDFADSTICVPVISLDDFVHAYGHAPPDLVKMDVEGGESDVLAGMRRLLRDERPTLFVSIHGSDRWSHCYQELTNAGYAVLDLSGHAAEAQLPQDEIVAVAKP